MSLTKSSKSSRTTAPTPPAGNPLLARFHRLWQDLEKVQARQAKKDAEHAAVYRRFTTEIEPLERHQCDLIFRLTERLVGFTARKSFTQWQREMLHEWIHDNIAYLESNPFRDEMDLEPFFMQIQSNTSLHMDEEMLEQQCDFITHMLMEACGHCPEDPEILREMVRDPEKLRVYMMEAMAQRRSASGEEADDAFDDGGSWADEDEVQEGHEARPEEEEDRYAQRRWDEMEEAGLAALFNKSSLKQLYRKLALALHPDREQDPVKREEKTRIMGQLSHVWEHKEMFTLLQLAHTHLPESENLLSEENLAYLNPMLKRRLLELEREYFRGPDGLMGAVVQKFKQSSKKKTESAFADHHAYLTGDIESLTEQLARITTLQSLKPYLAARWDTQQQARWNDMPDLDWLFQ